MTALKTDHVRYVRETDDALRRLKGSLEKLETDKSELSHQLQDEKRFSLIFFTETIQFKKRYV